MKKHLAQLLCCWIPCKKARKKAIASLKEFDTKKIRRNFIKYDHYYLDFLKHDIPEKSVLIVEPNNYHGEIIPGFVKYWQNLGYHVDVIMRVANYEENPFALFAQDEMPDIYPMQKWRISKVLKSKMIREYDFVFVSSFDYQETKERYYDYLGFEPQSHRGSLCIYHNCQNIEPYGEIKKYLGKRLFVLNEFPLAEGKAKLLCPIYFGNVAPHEKNSKTRFVMIGRLSPNTRNCAQLLEAIEKLLQENITDFEVCVIGSGGMEIPERLKKHIKKLGRLNFHDMYHQCMDSDFLLALLDPESPQQESYKHGTTTGSKQLSLGLNKPMLLEKTFADVYGFSEKDTIVYQGNCLYEAMKQAVAMDKNTYAEKCKALRQYAEDVAAKSQKNLAETIASIEG